MSNDCTPGLTPSYDLSPDNVVAALSLGNTISSSGNARIRDQMPIVPTNAMVKDPQELGKIPLRLGQEVYLENVARTLRAEIDLDKPKKSLRPNMYANVTVTGVREDVWTLPVSAVLTEGDVTQGYQSFIFRVEGGKVKRTPVQVGARTRDLVEVIQKKTRVKAKGKEPDWEDFNGQEVVVQGNLKSLHDGQGITVATKNK